MEWQWSWNKTHVSLSVRCFKKTMDVKCKQ